MKCGADTKDGGACSREVDGGRCWQHSSGAHRASQIGDGYCSEEIHPGSTEVRECFCGSAHEMIRGFSQGERRFFFNKGQFSLVDLATALTHHAGPVEFGCAVWTGTKANIDQVQQLVDSERITSARWVLCDSQRDMNEGRLNHLVRAFGVEQIRVTPLHAKVMVLRNNDWSIVVQSSANLTKNRSVEQFDVSDSPALCSFVTCWFDQVFESHPTLSEEPPFDGWSYEEVESRYQDMCVGGHFDSADPMSISQVGVIDGLR